MRNLHAGGARPARELEPFTVQEHVQPDDAVLALQREVTEGLCGAGPLKELSPKWLYDQTGSQLFDDITRLPEYYLTRREREILEARAAEIARRSGADTLIELGSGSSHKTRLLLDAFCQHGRLERFCPFDVSREHLCDAARRLAADYPRLRVHAVVGDFERHLGHLPRGGRRLVAFLGSTLGNFKPEPRAAFLRALSEALAPGDGLLLGTDLLKCRQRLHAAYNDGAGVTAEFNRNVLRVLNRELLADFSLEAFEHAAPFVEEHGWIEMRLISRRAQQVRLAKLSRSIRFEAGEVLRTEVSCKFRPEQVEQELAAAGLHLDAWWTDAAGDFALSLAFKR